MSSIIRRYLTFAFMNRHRHRHGKGNDGNEKSDELHFCRIDWLLVGRIEGFESVIVNKTCDYRERLNKKIARNGGRREMLYTKPGDFPDGYRQAMETTT
jgi:hypothetical protein